MTHCPLCHALYAQEDVKLVAQKEGVKLYHSACGSCGHGLLAYLLETHGGISSLGLVTDASGADALRLAQAKNIGSDECIQAHRLLTEHSRDLCRQWLDISGKLA